MTRLTTGGSGLALAAGLTAVAFGVGPAEAKPRVYVGPDVDVSNGTNNLYPGPVVKTYEPDAAAFGGFREINAFFAFDQGFTGGVNVAAGDVNGDGRPDIVTGTGPGSLGGGPHVRVFDGVTQAPIGGFSPFNGGFTGGVRVATGDVTGDGFDDIITGAGPGSLGGGPNVRVYDGASLNPLGGTPNEIASFFAYDPGFTGGVFVAGGDFNGDNRADIVVGPGASTTNPQSSVRVFDVAPDPNVTDGGVGPPTLPFIEFDAFGPGYGEGITVGVLDSGIDYPHPSIVTGTAPGSGFSQINVFDDEDLVDPIDQRGFFNDTVLTTGFTPVGGFDLNDDGIDELFLSRGNGNGASIFAADPVLIDQNGTPPVFLGGIVPFGEEVFPGQFFTNVGASVAAADCVKDPFSRVTIDITNPGTPFSLPFAPELDVQIENTDGLPDPFVDPFTLSALDPEALVELPGLDPLDPLPAGFELLPFTRGFFVEPPDGVLDEQYKGLVRLTISEAAKAFLRDNEITLQDLRLARLTKDPQGDYDLAPGFGGSGPTLGTPTSLEGDWGADGTVDSTDFAIWMNPERFSGFVVAYVPEPASALLLLPGLLGGRYRGRG